MTKTTSQRSKHLLVVGDNSRMREDFERFYEHPDFPNFVHACITSPPYKDKDGYCLSNIDDVARTLNEFLLGPLWLNFGDLADQMGRGPETAWLFQSQGFKWVKTVVWAKSFQGKGQYTPLRGKRTLDTRHEYIYLLVPKAHFNDFKLDRYIDGDPYTDISNIKRWKSGRETKCPGTIWFIPYETIQSSDQKLHSFRFPIGLPLKCIRHSVLPKDAWILDPWAGSCTTALAAKQLGYNSLSYEINEAMIEIAQERIPELEVITDA